MIVDDLKSMGCAVTPCGSQVTVNPPPIGSDIDYLVFCKDIDKVADVVSFLGNEKYHWEGATEHYQDVAANNFMSWRKDEINLIVTSRPDFVRRHKAATALCKKLNVMDKVDRIAIFRAYLYGNVEEPLEDVDLNY